MGKKYPEPPDPKETASAQTATNLSTAQANAILGNVNQVTPYGSLTYSQSGSRFVEDENGAVYWRGPKGEIQTSAPAGFTPASRVPIYGTRRVGGRGEGDNTTQVITGYRDVPASAGGTAAGWSQVKGYNIPQYTATTKLSPQQQAILDQSQAAQLNLSQAANERSAFLEEYLKKPFTLDNEATEGRLFELGRKRLDPVLSERRAALDQKLANQGIAIGSQAYDTAVRLDTEGANDAYNQLLLSGRGQAVNELLTERNQPLQEIISLLSGSQITQPTWAPANMPTIPTVDYAGLVNENFNQKMGIAQQKNAMGQKLFGGLFDLGSSLIMASDRRAKKDIKKVGKFGEHDLYAYRYKSEGKDTPKHVGFMAQDVEKTRPDAVIDTGGMKLVNYGKLLLEAA